MLQLPLPRGCLAEEVLEYRSPVLGQNGFRVELHAPMRLSDDFKGHKHAVFGPCQRLYPRAIDIVYAQGVVAHRFEILRNIGEWAGTCVADSADVPMFWFGCCLDASAIDKSESLVPKANSEHWYLVRGFDDVARGVNVLRVVWGARSR